MAGPSQCIGVSATSAHCLWLFLLTASSPLWWATSRSCTCPPPRQVTTRRQQLEVGIAMGCSISPTLFIAAFKVSLIGARQVMGGVWLPVRWRLPELRSYLDDITRLLQTAPCTFRPLKRRGSLQTGRAGIGCGSEPYYLRRYEDGAGGVQAEGDGTGGAGLLDNVEEGWFARIAVSSCF